jgi:hypothetical protein
MSITYGMLPLMSRASEQQEGEAHERYPSALSCHLSFAPINVKMYGTEEYLQTPNDGTDLWGGLI